MTTHRATIIFFALVACADPQPGHDRSSDHAGVSVKLRVLP